MFSWKTWSIFDLFVFHIQNVVKIYRKIKILKKCKYLLLCFSPIFALQWILPEVNNNKCISDVPNPSMLHIQDSKHCPWIITIKCTQKHTQAHTQKKNTLNKWQKSAYRTRPQPWNKSMQKFDVWLYWDLAGMAQCTQWVRCEQIQHKRCSPLHYQQTSGHSADRCRNINSCMWSARHS